MLWNTEILAFEIVEKYQHEMTLRDITRRVSILAGEIGKAECETIWFESMSRQTLAYSVGRILPILLRILSQIEEEGKEPSLEDIRSAIVDVLKAVAAKDPLDSFLKSPEIESPEQLESSTPTI